MRNRKEVVDCSKSKFSLKPKCLNIKFSQRLQNTENKVQLFQRKTSDIGRVRNLTERQGAALQTLAANISRLVQDNGKTDKIDKILIAQNRTIYQQEIKIIKLENRIRILENIVFGNKTKHL